MYKKKTVGAAFNVEMDEQLGYVKHQPSNGQISEWFKSEDGEFELDKLCDQDGSSEPELVYKNHTHFYFHGRQNSLLVLTLYQHSRNRQRL